MRPSAEGGVSQTTDSPMENHPPMNSKETISAISAELNIPAREVRAVVNALLDRLAGAIESGEDFNSPAVKMRVRQLPAKTVERPDGGQKQVPERRIGMLQVGKKRAAKAED